MKWRVGGFAAAVLVALSSLAGAHETDPRATWRIPPIDFSHAGYRGGGVAPVVYRATLIVPPVEGDDGAGVQAAIDLVSAMPADRNGHRGVVQLTAATYHVEGQIRIAADGVVLRGAADGGTTVVATGVDRRALIAVGAATSPSPTADPVSVTGAVPAGVVRLPLASTWGLKVGDRITIRRPSTEAWIAALGMDDFVGWRPEGRLNWKPGTRDIVWDRTVTAVEPGGVVIDVPLTTALDPDMGGGLVARGPSTARIREIGIEGLTLVSAHDPARPMDEDHSWYAVAFDGVEDGWARNLSARGFVGSVVALGETTRRITVQDVLASDPVSEIGGWRRRVFYTAGQQSLFVRCDSRDGIHDFGLGHAAAGPNVFLDCSAKDAKGDSGALESWASGALFDGVKVRGGAITLTHRGREAQGAGWAAANSLLWNCEATVVEVRNPPDAPNAAVGCRGERIGDGVLEDPRAQPGRDFHRAQPQEPASLYRHQLQARLGATALAALETVVLPSPPRGTPMLGETEVVAWRDANRPSDDRHPMTLTDGRFQIDSRPAYVRKIGFAFFQAQMPTVAAASSGPFLTRFAPGKIGPGLTDDLDVLVAGLSTGDVVQHNYGLWYDRRRVDHDFYGSPDQKDGEVWAPFIELPWARSGQGRAWDGLSKYDLTRFNPWFFDRLDRFAERAERKGVVLHHRMYLQHWLLESRSHYVDFPWRPMNALQPTGMPMEVPAAEVFWDVSDPVRRDLHRRYIRHTLDALKDRSNVVYGLDPEYTGPLSFVRFWLETIAEWEAETGRSIWVVLEAPKAVTDAVLDDPALSRVVDGIEFHHWTYRPDGTLFAVQGGIDKAPREQVDAIARPEDLANGADPAQVRRALWASTPAMRYRAYREYRDLRADLALLDGDDAYPDLSWAIEAAFPAPARARMRTSDRVDAGPSSWGGADADGRLLVYAIEGAATLRPLARPMTVRWASGQGVACLPAGATRLESTAQTPWAAWLEPAAACTN